VTQFGHLELFDHYKFEISKSVEVITAERGKFHRDG